MTGRLLYILLIFTASVAKAQGPAVTNLKAVLGYLTAYREKRPVEKLYLQLDKPYYTLGDTLRFKAYLLDADFLTPSTRSGLLYVELDDVAGKMAKRMMVPLASGVSWGDLALNTDEEITEGSYTLRAYTNWMRNFGEDYIYKKNIYISATSGSSTLIKADFKLTEKEGKSNILANLRFTDLGKDALRLKDMRLRIKSGRKTLLRDKATTGMDGSLAADFNLPDKADIKNLYIQVQNITRGADTAMLTIPVTINRIENTDVQFMPEGGNIVAGMKTKIGFKAIGEDGRSVNIRGEIVNSKQERIATFSSAHKGMGSFELTPQSGESYTAKVTLPGNIPKNYPLPAVNAAGTALSVIANGTDSVMITVTATPGLSADSYYLIGQARGVVCYAAHVGLNKGAFVSRVAKSIFPAGIAHFTVLSSLGKPLNERLIYIAANDNLQLNISSDKQHYNTRDSVALALAVTDKDGKPVRGIFSLAVTDNNQVKTDSLGNNILNSLLFTSDLRGTVEEPDYYLEKRTTERAADLDNLLLTQGWVGYDWKNILGPQTKPAYVAEKEFMVQGRLTNVFNKPLKQTRISLLQKQPVFMTDTLTDENGRFTFKNEELFPSDSTYYLVQVKNKKGENRTMNVGIDIDEFTPPVFTPLKDKMLPWYVNTDTLLLRQAATKRAQLIAADNYMGEGRLLKEVNIKAKKIIKDSHNLNGPGEADFVLDEAEMFKARNMTLFELLKRKYKDFHKQNYGYGYSAYYWNWHGDAIAGIVIDGVSARSLGFPLEMYMEDVLQASDIKGIEVMIQGRYAMAYTPAYKPGMVFLEITTYSGHGAFITKTAGKSVYKPIPLILPKDFYRPRYTVKNQNTAMGTDLRSTIHWEPNVVTDTAGRATVSFFSADKAANYTIIIEGTDLNGNLGYGRQKIKVMLKAMVPTR